MTKTQLLGFAVCLGVATGCGDDQPSAAPAPSVAPSGATGARVDREPARFTDEDRAVIAYLDAWEPLQKELRTELQTVKQRVTATRMDIARRRAGADPEGACAAVQALLARNVGWHADHPLPAPLTVERVFGYESNLDVRDTGKGDDLAGLAERVSRFHDHRDDFDRKGVFALEQQLENLTCDSRK